MSKARIDYERTDPPADGTRLLIVIAIDLALTGLAWLIVWGRRIYRGFAA